MIANFHTHTTFCDGKNTPEEVVISAIEKGFCAIGFTGHGYTPFDLSYCMKDTEGYILEITRLKEKYKKEIQIYLGAEEDAFALLDRSKFEYIIGSSHYFNINGKYFDVDLDYDYFKKCLHSFEENISLLAQNYYSNFCDYIIKRKPDIIGHFDLITKFDEVDVPYFSCNDEYKKIAEKYMLEAIKSDCIFEVNTGAVSRGYRTAPYPSENLLYVLKKENAKVIISSDSHDKDNIDFGLKETEKLLKDIGFKYLYTLYNNEFKKYAL